MSCLNKYKKALLIKHLERKSRQFAEEHSYVYQHDGGRALEIKFSSFLFDSCQAKNFYDLVDATCVPYSDGHRWTIRLVKSGVIEKAWDVWIWLA